MKEKQLHLSPGKKAFFASDFHLGIPTYAASREREARVIEWLESIRPEAQYVFLMGDLFDFWFEYRQAVPRGFVRFMGKLAELTDAGMDVSLFTGNHDMWMFDYLPKELGVTVYREPLVLTHGVQRLMVGHGDGLGPGDTAYKILKKFFNSSVCQWLFARIHPNLGLAIAHYWSGKSRIANVRQEEKFKGEEKEFLLHYCRAMEATAHYDYYIFGHRHLPLNLKVGESSRYINVGEWVHFSTYATYDGDTVALREFKP